MVQSRSFHLVKDNWVTQIQPEGKRAAQLRGDPGPQAALVLLVTAPTRRAEGAAC